MMRDVVKEESAQSTFVEGRHELCTHSGKWRQGFAGTSTSLYQDHLSVIPSGHCLPASLLPLDILFVQPVIIVSHETGVSRFDVLRTGTLDA